jgi:hypothetical protein
MATCHNNRLYRHGRVWKFDDDILPLGSNNQEEDTWDDDNDDLYSPTLRVFMALTAAPLALATLIFLLISPAMLAFMHDNPASNKFPPNMLVLFLFLVYRVIVALFGWYVWLLGSSAYTIGRTVIGGCHFSSPTCGFLVLLPAIILLVAYVVMNIMS